MIVMNIVYTFSAYPAGILSDRINRKTLLVVGVVFLVLADTVLAYATSWGMLALGVSLWGLHMGLTQGLMATLVTDTTPAALRGTAYGVFNLACGVAMLLASVGAGLLWTYVGSHATFLAGAGVSGIAVVGLLAAPGGASDAKPPM